MGLGCLQDVGSWMEEERKAGPYFLVQGMDSQRADAMGPGPIGHSGLNCTPRYPGALHVTWPPVEGVGLAHP